jgi:hypothetical protein
MMIRFGLLILTFVGTLTFSVNCRAQSESHLYWSDRDGVKRANVDGTGSVTLLTARALDMDIDPVGALLYMVIGAGIQRHNLDGSLIDVIVENPTGPMALDYVHRKLYWYNGRDDIIRRANLDGTDIESVLALRSIPGWEGRGRSMDAFEVDVRNDRLYWLQASDLYRSGLSGEDVVRLEDGDPLASTRFTDYITSAEFGGSCSAYSPSIETYDSGAVTCLFSNHPYLPNGNLHLNQSLLTTIPEDPFQPTRIILDAEGNLYWFDQIRENIGRWTENGIEEYLIQAEGPVLAMTTDSFIIPEPSTAILTLAAATLALLAALRRCRRTRPRSGAVS